MRCRGHDAAVVSVYTHISAHLRCLSLPVFTKIRRVSNSIFTD
jgi:hypothetical protein